MNINPNLTIVRKVLLQKSSSSSSSSLSSSSPPNNNPNNMEFPIVIPTHPKLSHEEQQVVQFLQCSKKGQIPYFTGWDTKPNSTLELISDLEERREMREQEIFSQVNQILEHIRHERRLENDPSHPDHKDILKSIGFGHYVENGSPLTNNQLTPIVRKKLLPQFKSCSSLPRTLSYSNSNLQSETATNSSAISKDIENRYEDTIDSALRIRAKSLSPANPPLITLKDIKAVYDAENQENSPRRIMKTFLNPQISKKRLGVRVEEEDREYNDFADSIAILTESPDRARIQRELEKLEREKLDKWENEVQDYQRKFEKLVITQNGAPESTTNQKPQSDLIEQCRLKWKAKSQEMESHISALKKLQALDDEKLQQELEATRELQLQLEKEKLDQIEKEKQLAAAAAAEEAKLQAEAEKAKAAAAVKKLEEEQEAMAKQKLADEAATATPKFEDKVPAPAPQKCIFDADMKKFAQNLDLISEIDEKFKDLKKTNLQFYSWARKVISNPLNQNSMDFQPKLQHFFQLFEGKPVTVPGVNGSFTSGQFPESELYLFNLFSQRFVKKAENEASENEIKRENLDFLAKIGIELVQRFPMLGKLIQAYFYKFCPFLVPFSYPRENRNVLEYVKCFIHDLKSGTGKSYDEANLTQMLLNNLSGYVGLYCYMVKNIETSDGDGINATNAQELSEKEQFFSLGEVWRILSKLLSLEPQMEVTATILNVLLDTIGEYMEGAYGRQYLKLVRYLKKFYIPKIQQVTLEGKGGSLARLELFLDKKYKHV